MEVSRVLNHSAVDHITHITMLCYDDVRCAAYQFQDRSVTAVGCFCLNHASCDTCNIKQYYNYERSVDVFTVTARVISRCPHTLYGETVRVSRLKPAPPAPVVPDSEVDWKRLLAKRLPAGTVIDELREYFKRVDSVNIVNMTLGKKPSVALLDLEQVPGQ